MEVALSFSDEASSDVFEAEAFEKFFVEKKDEAAVAPVEGFLQKIVAASDEHHVAFFDAHLLLGGQEAFFAFEHENDGVLLEKYFVAQGRVLVAVGHEGHVLNLE